MYIYIYTDTYVYTNPHLHRSFKSAHLIHAHLDIYKHINPHVCQSGLLMFMLVFSKGLDDSECCLLIRVPVPKKDDNDIEDEYQRCKEDTMQDWLHPKMGKGTWMIPLHQIYT